MPRSIANTSPSPKTWIVSYLPALIWAAFILVLISLPGKDLPDFDIWEIDIEDKIGHLVVFGFQACLIRLGLYLRGQTPSKRIYLIIFLMVSAFGGFTEILQDLAFPSRFASISDFIADALGAALGTVFAHYFFKKFRSRRS